MQITIRLLLGDVGYQFLEILNNCGLLQCGTQGTKYYVYCFVSSPGLECIMILHLRLYYKMSLNLAYLKTLSQTIIMKMRFCSLCTSGVSYRKHYFMVNIQSSKHCHLMQCPFRPNTVPKEALRVIRLHGTLLTRLRRLFVEDGILHRSETSWFKEERLHSTHHRSSSRRASPVRVLSSL